MFKELGVAGIFTLESSFCGCNKDSKYKNLHFTEDHLKSVGRDLCRALIPYCEVPTKIMPQIPDNTSTLCPKKPICYSKSL